MTLLFYLFRLLPMNRHKAVVLSFDGENYGKKGAAVAVAMQRLDPTVRIVWVKDREAPRMVFEMATSRAWILTHPLPSYARKRKGQLVVQTWHEGDAPGQDSPGQSGTADEEWEQVVRNSFAQTDLAVSDSDHLTYQIYLDAFHYDGELLLCGYRTDGVPSREQERRRERQASLEVAALLLRRMWQNGS